jgi:acyl-CoA dehydrogenase
MTVAVGSDQDFLDGIRRVADEVAAAHADEVDREARFPVEAIDALREQRALSAFLSPELGGSGVSFEALATACFELGRRCGASAMVFAMHQIQVVTLARHLDEGSFFEDHLRAVAAEQRLVASVTSEVGTGGDMAKSIAAVAPGEDGLCSFEKQAPTVSYGHYADDLLTSLRRSPDAEGGDQVLVLTRRDQHTLEPTGTWDPMGMRGTCSPGSTIRASFPSEQILGTPYAQVGPESMVPVSHILWSHLWLGIATEAFDRARSFVKASAKRSPGGSPPPAAHRLSQVMGDLSLLRAEVGQGLREYTAAADEPGREWLSTMAAALRFNNLKVAASEQAPRVCHGAMGVTGIVGFKNDTPFSVGRHLRDSMSACLMIANERIHTTNASLLLIAKEV